MALEIARFEDFELDAQRYTLRRGDRSLKLERIPMELLLFLVERRGELVTREEIIEKLWGKDVFVDTDNGINTAIRKIRQALRDDPEKPRFILTIAGKGYRFIAPVTEVTSEPRREGKHSDNVSPGTATPTPASGQMVSHYRLIREIGRGGMGVVYEAEDVRLGRRVALKFLAEKLAHGDEALARFLREARAASSLNHPNICTIYEVEEHEGRPVMVMELLEGETLKECLRRGPLSFDQLVATGTQLADALGAAHANGIVHRDIKPGNVFLTKRGPVKILDFGLAKLTPGHLVPAENVEDPLTRAGVLPGTTPYMSPEQLRGEELDGRSDLFSLGVVLYEAASGQKPFPGKGTIEIMNAILHSRPATLAKVNPSLPVALDRVVTRALEKDSSARYQTAAELRADLEALRQPQSSATTPLTAVRSRHAPLWIAAAALTVASIAWLITHRSAAAPIHGPAEWVQLTHFSDAAQEPALSPDGRMLAFLREKSVGSTIPFVAAGQIYVMLLPDGEPQPVSADTSPKGMIAFSPDGSRLTYTLPASWDTWVVPAVGGQAQLLLSNASGLSWIDAHRFLFSEIKAGINMGIVTAAENRSGARDIYLPPTPNGMAHLSHISPDQKWVLISGEMDSHGFLPCRLVPFDATSSGQLAGPPGSRCFYAAWSPDGRWMYFGADRGAGMHIFRQRFPDGKIVQITFGPTEEKGLSIAPDGRSLITAVTSDERNVWIHHASGDQPVSSEGFAGDPAFSSDGKKLFYLWRSAPSTGGFFSGELRSIEVDSGKMERVLPGIEIEDYAVSADAKQVVYTAFDSNRKARLWIAPCDRRSAPRQLTASDAADESNPRFGPQDEIFFDSSARNEVHTFRMRPDGTGREPVSSQVVLASLGLSPDGEWLLARVPGAAGETTDATVAMPVGSGTPLRLCSPECGIAWSADGKYFYLTPAGIGGMKAKSTYAIPLRPGEIFPPELLASDSNVEDRLASIRGTQIIPAAAIAPGTDPATYAFVSTFHRSNLYRIPVE